MRPVLTLTPNPALDLSATTPTVRPDVKLRCGPIGLTTGRMGRMGGNIAIRAEAPLQPKAKAAILWNQ